MLCCLSTEILIQQVLWKETKVFRLKLHHIITVSRQRGPQRYFLLFAAKDSVYLSAAELHEALAQTDGWRLLFHI